MSNLNDVVIDIDKVAEEIGNVDQSMILQTIINGLEYTPLKDILVKPLPAKKIMKVVKTPIPTGEVDEFGAQKYDVKEEEKEMESDFREGVVLSLPVDYDGSIGIGDIVVYHKNSAAYFDLFKDSQIIYPQAVVCKKIR